MKNKKKIDIEKKYVRSATIAKLRRLAECLDKGKRFYIQIAGTKISVPANAEINIEHERSRQEEEIEFEIKWKI